MIEVFKENNIKLTKQRKLVYEIISKLEDATIKDIQDRCLNDMDNSTIYRILELFLEKNIITKNIDDNIVYYSINKHEHKHYIYCIKCHKKKMIEICPISNIEKTGYKLVSHQIKINGICSNCQKNKG